MNKLTKDELEDIRACIDVACLTEQIPHDILKPLRQKIQSLIDNYCEPCRSAHEFYESLVCEQCGAIEDI